ncbi:hypothetical protein [Rhodoferax sp. GW822-FHT02A01]|uniref:hypothetical protein n=1 Tax=Rhodoferax sp. GW822-FHT02A01 TaxID=3141537 RepID=UPI00315DE663
MSVIALPTGLQVHTFSMGQQDFSLTFQNGDTGATQSRILAPARWTCTMSANQTLGPVPAATWRAFLLQLRGKTNQLAVYDLKNPTPKGTMAGSPTLTSAVAVGDTVINITTAALATLLQGDWFQLGTGQSRQMFQVVTSATASAGGAMSVTVEPPSRYAQSSGSAVVWSQPTCLMRRSDSSTSWAASADAEGNFTVNLVESWEP